MTKYILTIILLISSHFLTIAQNDDCSAMDGKVWVILNKDATIVNGRVDINNDHISNLFEEFHVTKFKQAFPYSNKEFLQRVYTIKFEAKTMSFKEKLEEINDGTFEKIITRPIGSEVSGYDPSDSYWEQHQDWLWHLTSIDAEDAWDLTKGDNATKVAVLDTWFDINHPDLENKIHPAYDPYDTTYFTTDCSKNNHGTSVASFIAAETDGGGNLASIGFNCMMIGYKSLSFDFIEKAHDASLRMDAGVISCSAGYFSCQSVAEGYDTIEQIAINEIIENGTIIVVLAGNGIYGDNCIPEGDTIESPWFPLHPAYDSNIIVVSSVGPDGKHYYYDSYDEREETHSHYPEVDICAPGYGVTGALCTEIDTCNPGTCCVTRSIPYSTSMNGTSFATPIVAGVCALMKSANPCLTQSEVQYMIKSTADEIADADDFPGMVGAGKINAYESVSAAAVSGTTSFTNHTFTSSQTTEDQYGISFSNVTFSSGTHIFNTRHEVSITDNFQINSGVAVTFDVDISNIISCE